MNTKAMIATILKLHSDLSLYTGVVVREVPSEFLGLGETLWEVLFTLKGEPEPVTTHACDTITKAAAEHIASELRKALNPPNSVPKEVL